MKAIVHLLTIVLGTIIGGVVGSVIYVGAQDGVLSATDVMGFAVYGGVFGAMCAILASTVVVLFGKVARGGCVAFGLALLGLGGWMTAVHHDGALIHIIGFSVLAGVLADFIARRADATVSAAGTVAAQGQNPKFSGDSSQ